MIPSWHARAACRKADPDQFYPGKGEHNVARDAKRICGHCPVRQQCLDYALETHQVWGIWGGLSERERRRLRKRRVA